jgi:hypothetical protein
LSVGDRNGKLVAEEELEVSLQKLGLSLEDLVTVRMLILISMKMTTDDGQNVVRSINRHNSYYLQPVQIAS